MAKKQLLTLLLDFVGVTFLQVHRSEPKDVLEATQPILATAPFRREAAEIFEDSNEAVQVDEFMETTSTTAAETMPKTTAGKLDALAAAPISRAPWALPRLPNHLAKMPGSKAWRPSDFQDLPAMPPEVWNASRAEMSGPYPLMESLLRRLTEGNETVRIEVFGGSMTVGSECCMEQCKMNEGQCAWPTLFGAYLQETFPNSVQLLSYARGGCNLECAETEMVVAQKSANVPVDWIILDFSQNGWGGQDHKLEELIRICHLFLPQTLVLLIYNRDMGSFSHTSRDDKALKILRGVAEHYKLPMLNYENAMEEFSRRGGSQSTMWPRNVQPTAWPDWAYRHPRWAGHAFYADMLAEWVNQQLALLETKPTEARLPLAQLPRPQLRKPKDVTVDEGWIPPLRRHSQQNIEYNAELCLFPLTTHLARNPESHTPLQSPGGQWRLFEDRRNKPGWIVTEKNDTLFFNVSFSGKPKLALQYLRSYEHLGTAEVTIHSPYVWHCKQLGGQGSGKRVWKLPGLWPPRVSITVGATFAVKETSNVSAAEAMGKSEAMVALRLVDGPKFKLLSVISC